LPPFSSGAVVVMKASPMWKKKFVIKKLWVRRNEKVDDEKIN
jgi:hypothetical protein